MANPNCVSLTRQEVEDAISKWLTSTEARDEAVNNYVAQKVPEFSGGWSIEKKIKALFPYFNALFSSYNKGKDTVMVPDPATITVIVSEDMNQSIEEQKRREAEGPLYIGGQYNTADEEITGVLTKDITVSGKGKDGSLIADLVEKQLRTQLRDAGVDIDSSENSKAFGSFIKVFKTGEYTCSAEDLFNTMIAACSIKDGMPALTAANLKKALKGDEIALDVVRNMVEDFRKERLQLSGLEKKVMGAVLEVYAAKNSGLWSALNAAKDREIRAANGSTRTEKALACALRAMKESATGENIDILKYNSPFNPHNKLSFTVTRGMLEDLERILKDMADDRGYTEHDDNGKVLYEGNPYEGFADYLERLLGENTTIYSPKALMQVMAYLAARNNGWTHTATGEFTTGVHYSQDYKVRDHLLKGYGLGDFVDKIYVGKGQTKKIGRDADGQYDAGLYTNDVEDILRMAYRAALVTGGNTDTESDAIRKALADSGGRKLAAENPHEGSYTEYIPAILEELRDIFVADRFEDDFYNQQRNNLPDNYAELADNEKLYRASTITGANIVYDSKTLRARTNAICYGIIKEVQDSRYKEIFFTDSKIKKADARKKELETAIKAMEDKGALTEEEENQLKADRDELKTCNRDLRDLNKYINELRSDTTYMKAMMKRKIGAYIEDAFDTIGRLQPFRDDDGKIIETVASFERRKEEIRMMRKLKPELTCRALAQLEQVTGVHVIMSQSLSYEVVDNQSEEANENDEEGAKKDSSDSLDYRDDEDPFAHLSQNVRTNLAMIPITDWDNKPILDDIGQVQYHDPKEIMAALLDMCDGWIADAEDFYEVTANSQLDDTDKAYAGRRNLFGMDNKKPRTAREAFPFGRPTFNVLKRNAGKYPWVQTLIDRLTDDFMERSDIKENNNPANMGLMARDLFCELGHTFMKRAMLKGNTFFETNTLAAVDSAKKSQQKNYDNRIKLEDRTMIYTGTGQLDKNNVKYLIELINSLPTIDEMRNGLLDADADDLRKQTREHPTSTAVGRYAEALSTVLRSMGFDVEFEDIAGCLMDLNNESNRTRVYSVTRLAKDLLEGLRDRRHVNPEDDNIYFGQYGRWRRLWEAAGYFVNKNNYQVSTTENGKTRYNYLQPNALTKTLNLLTYGYRGLIYGSDESRKNVLDDRRKKIDRMFGEAWGFKDKDGNWINPIIRDLYEGLDVTHSEDVTKTGAHIRAVGELVQVSQKDDLEYSQLSAADQMALMLGAAAHHKNSESGLFRLPVMADAPVMQFMTARFSQDVIGEMSNYINNDFNRIRSRRAERQKYVMIYAAANNLISHRRGTYYDAVDGEWKDMPNSNDWKIYEACRKFDELSEDEQALALPQVQNKYPGFDLYYEDYKKYKDWVPHSSYFTHEMKYGWIREIGTDRMQFEDVVDAIVARAENKDGKEALREKYKRYQSKMKGKRFTMEEFINAIERETPGVTESDGLRANEIVPAYTALMLKKKFAEEIRTRDFREPTYMHHELATLNRIEMFLENRPDFDGERWKVVEGQVEENGTRKQVFNLVKADDSYSYRLSDMEADYYKSRMGMYARYEENMMNRSFTEDVTIKDAATWFRESATKGPVVNGEKTYSRKAIANFQPPLVNQGELLDIMKKSNPSAKFEDVPAEVERVWYQTYLTSTAVLQMMGMDPAMFKSDEELTKRLKGMYSNGLRLDTNAPTGHKQEHYIVIADDETSISPEYAKIIEAYADMVSRREIKDTEAYEKCKAYLRINGSDAQGLVSLIGYRAKASMAGSSYWTPQMEELYYDIISGRRKLSDFNPNNVMNTMKQVGFYPGLDANPDGTKTLRAQFIKNSEAVMTAKYDTLETPKSALLLALDGFISETSFLVDPNDKDTQVKITSIQRPSGVKTGTKGVIDLRYLPSRVKALQDLLIDMPESVSEQQKFIKKFAETWKGEVDNVMKLTPGLVRSFHDYIKAAMPNNKDERYLSFDDIDAYIHSSLEGITKKRFSGAKDGATAKKEIDALIALRNFMMPVKSTDDTVGELRGLMNDKTMKSDGTFNDQYVGVIDPKYQAMQVRQSNHYFDGKSHLGSQASFLMTTGLEQNKKYAIEINGEQTEVTGAEIYDRFYACLAARLLQGIQKATGMFNDIHELQRYMKQIVQNNPAYGPEIIKALNIVKRGMGDNTKEVFETPLSSVAVIYKVSDILTSIIRNNTIRKSVNGGAVVIEEDSMYDENLSIEYDDLGNPVGVQCLISPSSKEMLQHCMVRKQINGKTVDTLDFNKLKGTGLEKLIGYRIPTEEYHSMLPLIIKGFLPPEAGAKIVVAKEITTLTGGDNDVDKLFLMVKNINKDLFKKKGELEPVKYDWDAPVLEQDNEAIENMMIDLFDAVLTAGSNHARWLAPQNPDKLKTVAYKIAYQKLPYEKKLKKRRSDEELVYEPENENWNNPDYYVPPTNAELFGFEKNRTKVEEHMKLFTSHSVQSMGGMVHAHRQHNMAKIGVAVGADNMSGYAKVSSGLKALGKEMRFKTEKTGGLKKGIRINNVHINNYCPETDVNGHSVMENCSDLSAAFVDSGKSSALTDIGINLKNASFAGFLLKCGFSFDMMAHSIAVLDKYPGFNGRYDKIYRMLTKEGGAYEKADDRDFGNLSMEAFDKILDGGNLLTLENLSDKNNLDVLSVFHVLRFFQRVHDNMRNYERTLKFNSAKHALSNEPASAVWSQLLVDRVEKDRTKLLVDVPEEMIVRNNVSVDDIEDGVVHLDDGREIQQGVPLPQMYYTCGIESFNQVMKDRLFYAHPAFMALVRSFTPLIEKLPKDKGIKFIKQLHDEFSAFYLSRMNMVNQYVDSHGHVTMRDFTDVRDYYRYQFPKEMEKTLKDQDLREKYAILRVMTVKDGKLMLDDDLKNELTKTDINASLARMANSQNKRERDMARNIWLCSYFTDGLRFSYGALSNAFEPSFLANKELFEEYNVTVEEMCTTKNVTGDDLNNFALQFVRNNFKQYQFGTLFRAKSMVAKNEEGLYEAQEQEGEIELADDEITADEVRRLEMWLNDRETGNMLMFDDEDIERNGRVRLAVPTEIRNKVRDMEPGTFFRVQVSFSLYDQNLYQVRVDENGAKYITKLQDFLGDKWYNIRMDILDQSEKDCMVDEKGKTAWKSKTLKDSVRKKAEEQKRFYEHGLSDKQLSHNQRVQRANDDIDIMYAEGADILFNSPEDMFVGDEAADMDFAEIDMLDPADVVPTFSENKPKKTWRRGDKTVEMNEDFFENLKNFGKDNYDPDASFSDEDEDFSASLMVAFDIEQRTPEEDARERRRLLDDAGALGVFDNYDDALRAAIKANNLGRGYIAVVNERDGGYRVDLSDISDINAANQWREQYGVDMMTGDQGINSVMNGVGDTSVNFIEPDGQTSFDQYKEMTKQLAELVEFAKSGRRIQTWPQISEKLASAFINKLRSTTQFARFIDDLEKMLQSADADSFVRAVLSGRDAAMVLGEISTMRDTGEVLSKSTIEGVLAKMLMSPYSASQALARNNAFSYINGKFKDLVLKTVRNSLSSTSDDAADKLNALQTQAEYSQPTVTPQQQRHARSGRAQATAMIDEIAELRKILEKARIAEERKYKMLVEGKYDVTSANDRLRMLDVALEGILGDGNDVPNLAGVMNYLKHLSDEYALMSEQLYDIRTGASTGTHTDNLNRLARMRIALRAHEEMLDALTSLVGLDEFRRKMADIDDPNGSALAAIKKLVETSGRLHTNMCSRFADIAANEFIGFVKDFVDVDDVVKLPNGGEITWKQLFESYDGDISWVDKWLRSMGDTNDPIGQLYDRVVKKQKDKVRNIAISDQQNEIRELNDFIVKNNLSNFEFMFERDEDGKKTGYYLSELNHGKFYKALREQEKALKEVKDNPASTQEQKAAAEDAYNKWVAKYAEVDATGTLTPKSEVKEGARTTYPWRNSAWDDLQRDTVRAEFMKRFMKIKREYDSRLGNHTSHFRAIQRRMSSEQRFRANFTLSPRAFFDNMKRKLAEDYLVREDDYLEDGERSTVLDFDGTERMVMPAPFVRMLKNPDELSTDPIGCLVAYSYASANYEAMREIVNPLEVGYAALVAGRVQYDEQNGRMTVEKFHNNRKEKAKVKESKFLQKLRSFMDTQLYMRYIADKDDTFKFMGAEFRKSKVVNGFLRMSAIAQLGFNWLVDIANLANGLAQTNIEAAARRYFSGTALRKADAEYFKALKDFVPDLSRPIKESRLALISEKLNIMQNFDVKIYNNRRNQLLSKLFNTQIAFMGTSCGNHWLYHRVAIASMLSTTVVLADGTKTNLWDAFEIVPTDKGGKVARVKPGAKLEDGTLIDDNWLHEFGRKTDKLNQGLIGIYNRDDMVMAQKISWAKLLISFRKHIVPLMDKRWRKKHINEFGDEEEGYMRTFGSVLLAIKNAQFNIPAVWDELSEEDKAAVRMALTDIIQFAALCMLSMLPLIGGDDDDDDEETRLQKICAFLIARERHELGSMLPTLYMPKEGINMITQPVMGTSQLEDIYNFCNTAFTPWTWGDRVKAGPFQGQTEIEMRFRKLPIPVLSYYRNIDKSMNGINNSTWFYNRGYVGKV